MRNLTIFVVLALFSSLTWSLSPSQSKKYRSDYEYEQQTDSFYKLHTETESFEKAKEVCNTEGAALMLPRNEDDLKQLHAMFKKHPNLDDYMFIDYDGQDHESADEHPIINVDTEEDDHHYYSYTEQLCNVINRHGEVYRYSCYHSLPFVCMVRAKDASYDSNCNVYAKNYQYVSSVGSCYRVSSKAATWNEAEAECRAQNAHLVILNSEAELAAVLGIVGAAPRVEGSRNPSYLFAGFRAEEPVSNEPVVFKTIFNQTLQEAGFEKWAQGEPNNYDYMREYCGSIFVEDGKFNDIICKFHIGYICEKETNSVA